MKLFLLAIVCVSGALSAPTWFIDNAFPQANAPRAEGGDLVEVAEQLGLNLLVSALKYAGLADTIKNKGPFTIFAPTNLALKRLERISTFSNRTLLANVLMYHVISGSVYSGQLQNDLLAPSLLSVNGKVVDIRANVYEGGQVVTASGSQVVKADQNATNGVIHVINQVIYPIPVANMADTLQTQIMQQYARTLVTALKAAGLMETLSGAGPFTLFAPNNEAFAKVPNLPALLRNKTALTDVLTYHVVSGTYYSAGVAPGSLKTVEGKDITIDYDRGIKLNAFSGGANVIWTDLPVSNGVVHIIDAVLMPPKDPWMELMTNTIGEKL